jgi:hypothetical protein
MEPFFIIGAQRSGTTLVRLILNNHSKVAIPEEGTFWMPLFRAMRGRFNQPIDPRLLKAYINYIKVNDQFKTWKMDAESVFDTIIQKGVITLPQLMSQLYQTFASCGGKPFWGDKTPSFFRMVSELHHMFPKAKFIHVIRDGRDVYLSMKGIEKGRENVAVAALEWSYKINKARHQLNTLPSGVFHELKYESLVLSPQHEIKAICEFLNIEYEPAMLDFWKSSDKYIGTHHSALIFQPISHDSREKWRHQLSKKDNEIFELVAYKTLHELEYPLISGKANSLRWIKAALKLVFGLPRRAFQIVYTMLVLQLAARFGKQTRAAGGKN